MLELQSCPAHGPKDALTVRFGISYSWPFPSADGPDERVCDPLTSPRMEFNLLEAPGHAVGENLLNFVAPTNKLVLAHASHVLFLRPLLVETKGTMSGLPH